MFDWIQLYMDLLLNSSPDIMIQTFNRIIITGEKNGDEIIVEKTKKIFQHFSSKLSFHYKIDIFYGSAVSSTKQFLKTD